MPLHARSFVWLKTSLLARSFVRLKTPLHAKFLKRLELFAVTEIVRLYPNAEFVKVQLHANGGHVNTLHQFLREQRDHMPLELRQSASGSWVVPVEYPVVQSSKAAARGQVAQTCLNSVFSLATSKETVVYPRFPIALRADMASNGCH